MNAAFGQNEDGAFPIDRTIGVVPLGDTVSRWCSRLAGYAALGAACTGVIGLLF
jgi:hypothetical protein